MPACRASSHARPPRRPPMCVPLCNQCSINASRPQHFLVQKLVQINRETVIQPCTGSLVCSALMSSTVVHCDTPDMFHAMLVCMGITYGHVWAMSNTRRLLQGPQGTFSALAPLASGMHLQAGNLQQQQQQAAAQQQYLQQQIAAYRPSSDQPEQLQQVKLSLLCFASCTGA